MALLGNASCLSKMLLANRCHMSLRVHLLRVARTASKSTTVSLTNKVPKRQRATVAAVAHEEEHLNPPPPSGVEKSYPQKITKLVDEIAKLTLLEVADLNQLLKKTLNIQDAPMMAMGAAAPGVAPVEEEEVAPKIVQTSFKVKLLKIDDSKKVAIIKEIKNVVEGMNLVQAKKFVEAVPQVVKMDVAKEEAEKLKAALEAVGATCEIE